MDDGLERAREHFLEGLRQLGAGRFEAAETSFVESLRLVPGRPSTLLNLGATRLHLGRPAEALHDLDAVLASEPGDLDAASHRAVALAALGRHGEALSVHDRVLMAEPSRAANRLYRIEVLQALGRHAEALDECDRLLAQEPAFAEAWFRRGQSLQVLDRHAEALPAYDRAVALDPAHAQAWSNRGGILRDSGRLDAAAEAYERAIASGGDAELNGYFLASVSGRAAPPGAPAIYVEPLFDDYAETFDRHVVEGLRYQAHTVLAGTLTTLGHAHFRSALDLGCGTGLCGTLLRTFVDDLEGVDLSPKMLAKARALGVYDRLVQADIVDHLQTSERRHDLVLAADVFIYIGDLAAVFEGVRRVTEPGALFGFSVEAATDEDAGARGFRLLPSLRYSHSARYLAALASTHGFELAHLLPHALREDQRRPVPGLYAYLIRR